MGILASIFGSAFASEPAPGRIGREDGFVDVILPITDHKWSKDGSLSLVARGSINGKVVGFVVDLPPYWKAQLIPDTPISVYWGKGHIRSIGSESDAFLALLAREYALPDPGRMIARVEITMIGLDSNPTDLRTTPARIKIFFEAGGEDSYGEAYMNIDLGSRILEFRDKDPEYHQGILLSLAGASRSGGQK